MRYTPLLALFCWICPVSAEPDAQTELGKPVGEQSLDLALYPYEYFDEEEQESWIDSTASYLSDSVHDFGTYLDHSWAKEKNEDPLTNRSYIRLRSRHEFSHRRDYSADTKVSMRVHLPHVRKNWKIVIDTDPNDFATLESKERDDAKEPGQEGIGSGDAVAGIRLEDQKFSHWVSGFDMGIKFKIPLDPFTRADIYRVDELNDKWTSLVRQEFFYFHSRGLGALTQATVFYPLNEQVSQIFTFGTSGQYLYDTRGWELVTHLGVSDRLNYTNMIEYSAGISFDLKGDDEVTNYWLSTTWHHMLYENWIYLHITPKLEFPDEFAYQANPGILLRLEAFISKNRTVNYLNRSIPQSTRRKE